VNIEIFGEWISAVNDIAGSTALNKKEITYNGFASYEKKKKSMNRLAFDKIKELANKLSNNQSFDRIETDNMKIHYEN
jgi:hypothetical protein